MSGHSPGNGQNGANYVERQPVSSNFGRGYQEPSGRAPRVVELRSVGSTRIGTERLEELHEASGAVAVLRQAKPGRGGQMT
jgi:hypothetical protein